MYFVFRCEEEEGMYKAVHIQPATDLQRIAVNSYGTYMVGHWSHKSLVYASSQMFYA